MQFRIRDIQVRPHSFMSIVVSSLMPHVEALAFPIRHTQVAAEVEIIRHEQQRGGAGIWSLKGLNLMSTLLALLSTFGQWAAKIFLGGLFNKVITQEDDEAQHKIDASVVQAQTANDSANVDIQIVKDQSVVKDHYNQDVPNPNDPFNNADWNGEPKK